MAWSLDMPGSNEIFNRKRSKNDEKNTFGTNSEKLDFFFATINGLPGPPKSNHAYFGAIIGDSR